MRKLTAKQKKLIDGYLIERKKLGVAIYTHEDLTGEEWEKIEKINDTEILWQEVDRYINDKKLEMRNE